MIKECKLILRASKRLGAFKRATAQGMSISDARLYSDHLYPPNADDTAYEQRLRAGMGSFAAASDVVKEVSNSSFPWFSFVALSYPVGAAIYLANYRPAPATMIAGYGLANLGYLLVAAAIIGGTFRVFGLRRRWQIFVLAIACFLVGTLLSNVS